MIPLLIAATLAQPPTVPDSPSAATAAARHFLLLFGSDAGPLRPARTHTWATYVRANNQRVADAVTISWLPADLVIDPLRPRRAEAGVNLGLHETFRFVAGQGQKAVLFGPFETDAARFVVAQTERDLLAGGTVSYRAASDPRGMPPGLANCITAVGSVEPAVSRRLGLLQFGRRGTARAAKGVAADADVRPAPDAAGWLLPALKLDAGSLTRSR